jgi:chromate reductase
MIQLKILTLVGGISRHSLNQKLFRGLKEIAKSEAEFIAVDLSSLPFFSQDLENDPPDRVSEFKDHIRGADAVLFITPEYNRSIPGVLKNAIDWGSRPYGHNLWDHLPAGIMGASIGNVGTFGAQHHLRQILSYLNMEVMNQPEFYFNGSKAFDDQGKLIDDSARELLKKFWSALKEWIEHSRLNQPSAAPEFITGTEKSERLNLAH